MRKLGILVLHLDQEKEYFKQLGIQAQKYEFDLYMFTPEAISFSNKLVRGKKFTSELTWMNDTFELSSFIYDRCFYPSIGFNKHYSPYIRRLKQHPDCTFLAHGLPGKLAVYQALTQEATLKDYLPVTEKLENIEQLYRFRENFHAIILKPISGSQGKGIYQIKKDDTQIENLNQITADIQKGSYLIQPYLNLVADGRPFDIRILLQKNEKGVWTEQGRGVRVGNPYSLISNLHAGGQVIDYNDWLTKHFKSKKAEIDQTIKHIVGILPEVLDRQFPPLFELGLDIGIDKDADVWILEVNSKPGYQVLQTFKNYKMYEAPFLYCLYLLEKRRRLSSGVRTGDAPRPR